MDFPIVLGTDALPYNEGVMGSVFLREFTTG